MAWLPVSAPSALTKGSACSDFHSFSAPSRASECSTCTVPRRRTTSSAQYLRVMPFQRGLLLQSRLSWSAVCRLCVFMASVLGALKRGCEALPFKGRVWEGMGLTFGGALLGFGRGVVWHSDGGRETHPHPGPPLEGEGERHGLREALVRRQGQELLQLV